MGGYGFLRFSLPMFPLASAEFAPLIFTLSVVAIIYTSLVALMQEDMKKLIAYSSVAHMGFVTMGIFADDGAGRAGRDLPDDLARHRLGRAVPVRRRHLRPHAHARDRGLWRPRQPHAARTPSPSWSSRMANVGLPGTSGFVGEFLTLLGAFRANTWVALLATIGVILSAAYALWLYRRVIFGQLEKPASPASPTSTAAKSSILAPLVLLTIFFGVYPAAGARHDGGVGRRSWSTTIDAAVGMAKPPRAALRTEVRHELTRRSGTLRACLPEIVLGVGAHGAPDVRRLRRRATRPAAIDWLSVVAPGRRRRSSCWLPARPARRLQRRLRRRRLRPLHQDPGADRLGRAPSCMSLDFCASESERSSSIRCSSCWRRSA